MKMNSDKLFNVKDSVHLLKHTKHPLHKNAALNDSLGVPGLFPVPEYGEAPETTYCADYESVKGYEEPIAAGLRSESLSLLDAGFQNKSLFSLIRNLEHDLDAWELECSVDVVHRSDGLIRFLRKANPAMDQKKRQNWFEKILEEDCSLRELAAEDEIPVQQTPKTAKSLSPIVDVFTEKRFPSPRATWYLKIMLLRKEWKDQNKRSRPQGSNMKGGMIGANARLMDQVLEKYISPDTLRRAWTQQVVDYMVGKLWDVADYKDGGLNVRRPSLALSSSTSSTGPNKSWATIQKCVVRREKLNQWETAFRYFCWQYENGMLHKQMFLEKLLAMMLRMRDPEGIVTKLGRRQPLPLALCFVVVTKVCHFITEFYPTYLYEFWQVCADNLRQLLWVGSNSKQSLFYDPDFARLVEALQLGLEFVNSVAPERVDHWGRMFWASPQERALFKSARVAERIARAESEKANPRRYCDWASSRAAQVLSRHTTARDVSLPPKNGTGAEPRAVIQVPVPAVAEPVENAVSGSSGEQDRRGPHGDYGRRNSRSSTQSGANAEGDRRKSITELDAWQLLEVVPDTASLSHLLAGARRVRRTPRFR